VPFEKGNLGGPIAANPAAPQGGDKKKNANTPGRRRKQGRKKL